MDSEINIRAVVNGFTVGDDFGERTYVFSTWEETLAHLKTNPPKFEEPILNKLGDRYEVNI